MVSILLAVKSALLCDGLRSLLANEDGLQVCQDCADGGLALDLARKQQPDVIVMDLHLTTLSGVEVSARLLRRVDYRPNILVFADWQRSSYLHRLMEIGVQGYMTTDCRAEELVRAVHTVAEGRRFVGHGAAQQMAMGWTSSQDHCPFDALSARELEVMLMLTAGQGIRDIADTLKVSPKTVSTYKYRLFDKVGVRSEVELLRLAWQHQVLEPDANCARV